MSVLAQVIVEGERQLREMPTLAAATSTLKRHHRSSNAQSIPNQSTTVVNLANALGTAEWGAFDATNNVIYNNTATAKRVRVQNLIQWAAGASTTGAKQFILEKVNRLTPGTVLSTTNFQSNAQTQVEAFAGHANDTLNQDEGYRVRVFHNNQNALGVGQALTVNLVILWMTLDEIETVKGVDGTNGPGYRATSTTNNTIASSGSKPFVTQTGLAYTVGARVRASNSTSVYMEGPVTAYNPGTGALTFTADYAVGSGNFSSWNINLAGDPGTAGGALPGTLLRETIYLSAGTFSWSKHPDANFYEGDLQGSGAAGGGAATTVSANLSAGSGGGSGDRVIGRRAPIQASTGTIVIGAPGAAVSGANAAAAAESTFAFDGVGVVLRAIGGQGGLILAEGTSYAGMLGGTLAAGTSGGSDALEVLKGNRGDPAVRLSGVAGNSGGGAVSPVSGNSSAQPRFRNSVGGAPGNGSGAGAAGCGGGGGLVSGLVASVIGGPGREGRFIIREYA